MRTLIIPAAGAGTRLGSPLPKLLVPVLGRPMIDHLLARYRGVVDRFVVVVNPAREGPVRAHLGNRRDVTLAFQPSPTGMLDAILVPASLVGQWNPQEVWITWCDQVGILPDTVQSLEQAMAGPPPADIALPTVVRPEPYIHFDRDPSGRLTGVRQRREGDPMPDIGEGDAGLFALSARAYLEWLPRFAAETTPDRGTGERNFLPFLPWAARTALVRTVPLTDPGESVGINTPTELAQLETFLRTHA